MSELRELLALASTDRGRLDERDGVAGRAIRISVSNWSTSDRDVERTLAAFASAAAR